MGERQRNKEGEFNDRIPPSDILDVFDDSDDIAHPVTASDIVDELGIARRTAHNKLNRLVDRDVLETRKVGARGRIWWRPIPRDEWPGVDSLASDPAEGGEASHTDPEAVRNALDTLESAYERGDRHEARAALQRARNALPSGGE